MNADEVRARAKTQLPDILQFMNMLPKADIPAALLHIDGDIDRFRVKREELDPGRKRK